MAQIFPFAALRYNHQRVTVQRVVTQPYDKITPEMQGRYYQSDPHNLVRLILGKSEAGDDNRNHVYSRAANFWREWRRDGILVADPQPSLYRYTQRFSAPGTKVEHERVGLIALGQLEDYDRQIVYRHEQTLTGPKADRLSLLRATSAHFEQIFMLYGDPQGRVDSLLATAAEPVIEVTDEYDVLHRMERVAEPKTVAAVTAEFRDKKLLIADGHHRYETALTYRNERRQNAGKTDPNAPYERMMMTFVNMDRPGLVILPGHRVVHSLPKFESGWFVEATRQHFRFEQMPGTPAAAEIQQWLEHNKDAGTVMVAVTAQGAWTMRYMPETTQHLMSGLSARQQQLDVVILHRVVIETMLGISQEDVRSQKHVNYYRDADEAIARVRRGEANVAFLMNPVTIEQMREISFAGEVMPQKSTDFYPKMLSGLTMDAMD
jgi:uncharacterized protein (DUF1015 family)